jgi:hypothetical protein
MVPSFGSASINAVNRTTAASLGIRARCNWLESEGDSRIGEVLIQPVGWAEASRYAEAIFSGLA